MIKKIIIVGAFHEIIELAEENNYEIVGLIDNDKINSYRGYKILGNDEDAELLQKTFIEFPIIITPDKPAIRHKLHIHYEKLGFTFSSLISKDAKISRSATLGLGTIVQTGVNISAECFIGKFVKLNTNSNVMHNSIIGDYTTIAPNAVILGNVKIGKFCYLGANSTILPNLLIGDNVIVGAGAVVTKNIEDNLVVAGNPARILGIVKN